MNNTTIHLPNTTKRTLLTTLLILAGMPGLLAQRGVPVPVPPGAPNIFPDWLIMLIVGIIVLVIAVNFFGWFISCFRSWKAFSELLMLIGGMIATLLFWQYTPLAFGWCLLAAYLAVLIAVSGVSAFYQRITRRS